ncbi:MAG: type II toxin-antitoxin system RelE/ParE family toxin [Gammaproteobacteria bacterium]|nr:type II toxin-antitoxin system RelE/ParE family toxin [Gammaproteobacteria bacterium]
MLRKLFHENSNTSSSSQDLIDGYYFYEQQSQGIGSYFLDSLYANIDSLLITAGVHEKAYHQFYRLLAKHFPFAVYYKIDSNNVYVYAVLDCIRKPAWIRKKLHVLS